MKPIALIGGGGHARSIVEMTEGNALIEGYIDRTAVAAMDPLRWLGDDECFADEYSPDRIAVHPAVGFTRGCSLALRRRLMERYGAYEQPALVAPSAWVGQTATIGEGSTVMARAVINAGTNLGRWVVVNSGAIIEHDCRVGDNSFIAPGAVVCGGGAIGEDVFIGAGAIVKQGLTIASGAIIGMGAVVVRDITRPGVYVGNPAKEI